MAPGPSGPKREGVEGGGARPSPLPKEPEDLEPSQGGAGALLPLWECVPRLPNLLPLGWSSGPSPCLLTLPNPWWIFSNVFLGKPWPRCLQNLGPGRVSHILRTCALSLERPLGACHSSLLAVIIRHEL